jgi:glutamate/tyrosine decarboxylase-like PLP-dependent enzyme
MSDDARAARFPEHGRSADDVLEQLRAMRGDDLDWRGGKAFSLVYNHQHAQLEEAVHGAAELFLHENALNPFAFPSLLRMEQELVAMAADLLHGDPRAGALTSGGTESIFLAVQVARDQARTERGIAEPKVVTAITAHPAFAKACKYLDVEHVLLPVGDDLRLDPGTLAEAMDERTGLVVASSPCYPYGVIDPVADIAALAAERGVLCHVDACLGGWLLPWWERLGETVPPWDLSVEGVTSLSADVHKYGYTFKGASILLHRSRDLWEKQVFMYDAWPGGLYASATTAGTRPAAPIAGAWTAIQTLGADGYLELARVVRDTTRRFQQGIAGIDGLSVTGEPDLSVFEFGSDTLPMDAIADVMDDRRWKLDRQQGGLHVMVSPGHADVVEEFLDDLAFAVANHGDSRGTDHVYGGVA